MTTVAMQGLSALDYVCLDILRMWWAVCRKGRGGRLIDGRPWVRVTTEDMLEYLERRGVEASPKQVQRALKRLGDSGNAERKQLFLKRWDRRMWFAPSTREQQLHELKPTTIASKPPVVTTKPSGNVERTKASPLIKSPSSPTQSSKGSEPTAPTATKPERQTGVGMRPEPQVVTEGPRPASPVVTHTNSPRSRQGTTGSALVSNRRSLAGILARCLELGGFSSTDAAPEPEPVSPSSVILKSGQRLRVDDGVTAPLR